MVIGESSPVATKARDGSDSHACTCLDGWVFRFYYPSMGKEEEKLFVHVDEKSRGAVQTDSHKPGASFLTLIAALPVIVYALDSKGHFIFLNDAVRSLGYEPESLLGRHFTELIHDEDKLAVSRDAVVAKIRQEAALPQKAPKLFDERRSGQRMTRELLVRLIHGRSGETVYASVNAYGDTVDDPALNTMLESSEPVTIGVIHDITATRLYQKSLEDNLSIKEILLKEAHQRVRDNLQVVASLAHLNQMEEPSEVKDKTLSALITQIKAIALVHEVLYETESAAGVSSKVYFERFTRLMTESYGALGSSLLIKTDIEDRSLDAKRISYLAIVASQWISEIYRRAAVLGNPGILRFSYSVSKGEEILTVCGEDSLFGAQPALGETLGMEIAQALAQQLGGRVHSKKKDGFCFSLILPVGNF